jgi:hypothetical protein
MRLADRRRFRGTAHGKRFRGTACRITLGLLPQPIVSGI